MVFTCYYKILFIICFFSRCSKFSSASFLLIIENTFDVKIFLLLRCIPYTEYSKSLAMERMIIKGIVYREIKQVMYI